MTRYVVLDTETTGTAPDRDRVVWVAAAIVEERTVTQRWSTFLDPGPNSRVRVAGIDLAGQPTFADVAPRLTDMLQDGVLVAHNAPFDVAFLTAEYKRVGLAMPEVSAICTLRLARRLELKVASFSLVDCCAHFGISHQRCHRADEDVEATVQLLQKLLPLASARGWDSADALAEALAPTGDELTYTFEINLEEVLETWLVEQARWRPEEESAEEAMARYGRQLRAERDAAYARMRPDHRAAHQRKDALDSEEVRASEWLPVLHALEAADCPEVGDAWVEYARRLQGPARNVKRVLEALHRALDLYLSSAEVTRAWVDDAVTWIRITCDEADLPDKLIEAYQTFGPHLAALPPCGQCGNPATGCLGGRACKRADLASAAAWAAIRVAYQSGAYEDPETLERRARTVLPLLAAERDLAAYVGLGAQFGGRLVAWGRAGDALALWDDVVAGCADRAHDTDRLAETLAAAKHYADAVRVAGPALEAARRQGRPELFWRIADHFAFYLERTGRLEEAMALWQESIDAGSAVPRTFDRLSLALDRAGNPTAAAELCEIGMERFLIEGRRNKLVEQIAKRGQRCRAKAAH
jgi:DNA polymerase III epsilon subunit-like protein